MNFESDHIIPEDAEVFLSAFKRFISSFNEFKYVADERFRRAINFELVDYSMSPWHIEQEEEQYFIVIDSASAHPHLPFVNTRRKVLESIAFNGFCLVSYKGPGDEIRKNPLNRWMFLAEGKRKK